MRKWFEQSDQQESRNGIEYQRYEKPDESTAAFALNQSGVNRGECSSAEEELRIVVQNRIFPGRQGYQPAEGFLSHGIEHFFGQLLNLRL